MSASFNFVATIALLTIISYLFMPLNWVAGYMSTIFVISLALFLIGKYKKAGEL